MVKKRKRVVVSSVRHSSLRLHTVTFLEKFERTYIEVQGRSEKGWGRYARSYKLKKSYTLPPPLSLPRLRFPFPLLPFSLRIQIIMTTDQKLLIGDSHTRVNLRSRDKVKVQTFSQRSGAVHTLGQFCLDRMFGHELVAGHLKK